MSYFGDHSSNADMILGYNLSWKYKDEHSGFESTLRVKHLRVLSV